MFAFALRPQSIKQVYNDTFKLYQLTFPKVWFWSLIGALILALPQLSFGFSQEGAPTPKVDGKILMVAIIATLISTFFDALVFHRIYSLVKTSGTRLEESLRLVAARFITIIGASCIYYVLFIGGTVLFVVPGLFVFVLLAFYMPFILLENASSFKSLELSASLVWGTNAWWRSFVTILLPLIIMWLIMQLLTRLIGQQNFIGVLLSDVVLITFFKPFTLSIIMVQYHNLKLVKGEKGIA